MQPKQSILSDHWAAFKRVLNTSQPDSIDKTKLGLLKKLLIPTEERVMDGNAFKSLVDQDFDEISLGIKVTNNQVLAEELGLTFRWAVVDSYLPKHCQKP